MDSIDKLIKIFKDFPTVGQRTAGRFVYYLLRLPKERTDELVSAISELKNKIKLCPDCFNPCQTSNGNLCSICSDQKRDKNMLCIVEKEADLLSLESIGKYNGLYFILGGTVSVMNKEDMGGLRLDGLRKRLLSGKFSEIIVALNPTPEGKTTSVLVESLIKEINKDIRITHLARGIPVGGELEYADEETLESALLDRK